MEVIIFGWVDTGFQFEDLKSSLAQVIWHELATNL